jgi:hypothetical protein
MISKIKLAKGDAIVHGESRVTCLGWVQGSVVLQFSGMPTPLMLRPSQRRAIAHSDYLLAVTLLPIHGIGRRWQFEVEAPDNVKIKIERKAKR